MIGKRNKYQRLFTPSGCLTEEALKKFRDSSLNSGEQLIVEKHLSKCNLCSDAIEGLKLITDPARVSTILEEINSKLKVLVSKRNNSITYKKRQISDRVLYLSAAATVTILIGWLIFLNLNKPFGLDKITVITNTESSQKVPATPVPKDAGISSNHEVKIKDQTEEITASNSNDQKNEIGESNNKALTIIEEDEKKNFDKEQPSITENLSDETDQLALIEGLEKASVSEETIEPVTIDIASNQPIEYYMGEVIIQAEKANLIRLSDKQMESTSKSELAEGIAIESETRQKVASQRKSERILGEKTPIEISEKASASIIQATAHFFKVIDSMPVFPGGIQEMNIFLKKNLQYPVNALENQIEGTLYVSFIVEEDGKVSNIFLVRGLGSDFDKEALRVMKLMPAWTPGYKDGKPVKVQISLPIKFQLY
jgi:TonB family protein